MSYVRGSNPIWSYVDLTGKQFDDTYYMFVLQNVLPYLPETVYHEPDGTPWTNPIQFLANGTLPEDIYFDPGSEADPKVYRLEFRKGNTQNDPLIYLVENYIPGSSTGGNPPDDIGFVTDNQITNPQFSLINFTSPLTIASTTSIDLEVCPGWTLSLALSSGTGNATITQVPLNNSASTQTASNAPYALELNLSGWSSAILKQRFTQNGMLWANKVVSSSVTARTQGATGNIQSILVDSNGTTIATLLPSTLITNTFNEYPGKATLPATSNPDLPPAAYIEYQLILPTNIDIYLTSFQLIAGNLDLNFPYEQDTIERQVDNTFHYFKPQLEFKPIPSYLVGWDFPLNPAQFGSNSSLGAIGANKSAYIWDQTLCFQTVNNSISYERTTSRNNLRLTATATTQTAIIQYFDATQAKEILSNKLSVMVRCLASQSNLPVTVSIWYTTTNSSLPNASIGNNNSIVTGLDLNGFPTVVGGWNELVRSNLQKATFTAPITIDPNGFQTNGFNQWPSLPITTINSVKFMAVVIGTGSLNNTQTIEFASASLVAGDVPTIPAPKTADEVLRQCQYFYEQSYSDGTQIGTANTNNLQVAPMFSRISESPGNGSFVYANAFGFRYKVRKRIIPATRLISTTGTTSAVRASLYYVNTLGVLTINSNDITVGDFFTTFSDVDSSYYLPNITVTPMLIVSDSNRSYAAGFIRFHYTIDARLGIV